MSQSAAMLEAAAQAKKVRERELTKSKKPSTLKKVGSRVCFVVMMSVSFNLFSLLAMRFSIH